MTDERVDEVLSDLDEALSVDPSPAVAARVRTRIAAQAEQGSGAWPRLTTAAALLAVGTVATLWWGANPSRVDPPRQAVTAADVPRPAQLPAPSGSVPSGPVARTTRASAPPRRSPSVARPAEAVYAAPSREPDVIVSPQARTAFEQLQAAALAGRLSEEFFAPSQAVVEPTILTPTVVEVRPIEIERVRFDEPATGPTPEGSSGSGNKPGPVWPAGPLSRTRSTL
jgi:hypothetical protein